MQAARSVLVLRRLLARIRDVMAGEGDGQARLARRHESFGTVSPERGARFVEVQRAEHLLAEVAVLAAGGV